MLLLQLAIASFFSFFVSIDARAWNDTGKGAIIFEEAWTIPELADQQKYVGNSWY
jgi:hypothetical protein